MDIVSRRKKNRYQSWHRGTRENDLLLGQFADAVLSSFSEADLELYEAFLEASDQDLFAWITDQKKSPEMYASLIETIRAFHHDE